MAARGVWYTRVALFYSKQKPRVCTINHKPRHGTTVLYNAIARRALFGHGLGTDCARGYQIAARRYCICVKGRGRFSWGRRSRSCRCELLSLIVATCVEAIAVAEQQLNKTVVSSRSGTFVIQLTMLGAR